MMKEPLRSIEDFLTDEQFKSWVIQPTPDTDSYWDQWLADHPDQLNNFNSAKSLIQGISFNEYQIDEAAKSRILGKIRSETKDWNEAKQVPFLTYWAKIAAILVLVFGFGFLTYHFTSSDQTNQIALDNMIRKTNPLGVRSHYSLPDGTEVYLNAGSSIAFPRVFNNDKRVVELTGEAYFEVKHDASHPFEVVSKDGFSVNVLGTRFNYNTAENTVALLEGSVKFVQHQTGNSVLLAPGDKSRYFTDQSDFITEGFDVDLEVGWKDGKLVFKDSEFNQVRDRLTKWYGVTITVKNPQNIGDWSYTASFSKESLETVLLNMSTVKGFDYTINDEGVVIEF